MNIRNVSICNPQGNDWYVTYYGDGMETLKKYDHIPVWKIRMWIKYGTKP